jgi:organic hydroperoxide reductase OsmC/OhrA
MQDYPHHYRACAAGGPEGSVDSSSPGLVSIAAASPPEFGGPGGHWSPETMLVASVANCFLLTFRAIARASKLEWVDLRCEAEGLLENVDRVTRFTAYHLRATLVVRPGVREEKALRLMQKAEQVCLITNSLNGEIHLEAVVEVAAEEAS